MPRNSASTADSTTTDRPQPSLTSGKPLPPPPHSDGAAQYVAWQLAEACRVLVPRVWKYWRDLKTENSDQAESLVTQIRVARQTAFRLRTILADTERALKQWRRERPNDRNLEWLNEVAVCLMKWVADLDAAVHATLRLNGRLGSLTKDIRAFDLIDSQQVTRAFQAMVSRLEKMEPGFTETVDNVLAGFPNWNNHLDAKHDKKDEMAKQNQ